MNTVADIYAVATAESAELFGYFKELLADMQMSLQNESTFQNASALPAEEEFYRCFRSADTVFIFYSEKNRTDEVFRERIGRIVHYARNRDIRVFVLSADDFTKPVYRVKEGLRVRVNTDEEIEREKQIFGKSVWLIAEDGWIKRSVRLAVSKMYEMLNTENEKKSLYHKLIMLRDLGGSNAVTVTLSKLIQAVCSELRAEKQPGQRLSLYKEVMRLMTELYESYLFGTHEEIVETAKYKLAAINDAVKLLDENEFKEPDLFYSAYAVCVYYLYALIEHETVEEWTGGDVLILIDKSRKAQHTAAQQPYLDLYNAALSRGADASFADRPEDERKIILDAKNMAIKDLTDDGHSVFRRENGVLTSPFKKPKFVTDSQSEEDKLLSEISLVLKKAMTLFEKVPDGDSSGDFFRYLRTAYERLQNYSQVIGSKEVAVECIERITEITDILDHMNAEQSDEGKSTAGLRTLLGLKVKKEGSYDVFISYKHENKEIAGRMYAFCEMLHLSTFVDFKTLPELSNSEYEEAIMSALENSKHFVVILTDLSQLESHWIKLEMKIFEQEISEGRKEGSNFILVVSDDVFDEVISTNKRCIPIRYRAFEIMRISDYREMLGSYLT